MKEIIAIIRPRKMAETKAVLEKLGYPSMTAIPVLGRGKQKGIVEEVGLDLKRRTLESTKNAVMKYIPKRQIHFVARDGDVDDIVQALIKANQTGQHGDGKIFVCPIDDIARIRTKERGQDAL
ncbi:MAG: P-II family nitrogen regulator [Clostridiales bacterium]|nr:P-II family nitrogen regulator [Clostridiales bacterium]MDR2750892.1 P-II family nitrogen regulator [Clostridiales bacterium]